MFEDWCGYCYVVLDFYSSTWAILIIINGHNLIVDTQLQYSSMWFLNFCAPFLYDTTGSPQTIRYIMYVTLLIEFIVYIFFIAKYKIFGEPISIKANINEGNQDQEHLHVKKQSISYQGFGERQHRLDQKQFKEWYLHYFGLHSVAVGGCIMYSPYTATVVFAILQLILFMIVCAMQGCKMEGASNIIYSVLMTIMVLMDVLLLFSVTMGVGASGYDLGTKNCYLLQ